MAEIDTTPILKSFQILGLHGYKNVALEFTGPARIVIAENDMGKTTILSALQAFLTKCPSGDFMSRMNRLSGGPS